MTNKIAGFVNRAFATISGKMVVTYIHTNERKMVLPIAAFLNALNQGWDILGAEYKNVITAERHNQNHSRLNKKKKMPEPASPAKKSTR